jgi:hypothetical protein
MGWKRSGAGDKFFRTHNFAIFDVGGRKTMIDEVKDIQNKLARAHSVLHAVSSALETFTGRGGMVEKSAKQFLAQGKKLEI